MLRNVVSLLVQIGFLLFVIIYAATVRRMRRCIIVGIIAMSFANVFGNIVFGEGHTACPGVFIFPLYGIFSAWITIHITNAIHRKWVLPKGLVCSSIMRKVRILTIAFYILAVLSVITWYLWYSYLPLPAPLEHRLAMAEETIKEAITTRWELVKNSVPPEEFAKQPEIIRYNNALQFLKNRSTLERPYLVQADISYGTPIGHKEAQLMLTLEWLEDGFQTEGILLTQIRQGHKHGYGLGVFSRFDFWDNRERCRKHIGTAIRRVIWSVVIGNEYMFKESSVSGVPLIVVPADILDSQTLIRISDNKRNTSDPIELSIEETAREFILKESGQAID